MTLFVIIIDYMCNCILVINVQANKGFQRMLLLCNEIL